MKIELDGRRLRVKMRAKTWDLAYVVAKRNRDYPPAGYKMIGSEEKGRDKSGSRCSMALHFLLVDSGSIPMTAEEAYAEFQLDADVASGKSSYPLAGVAQTG